MNTGKTSSIVGLLLCLVTVLAAPQGALAAYTPACTVINNTATVDFKIGGGAQPQAASNILGLTVGNRVDHTVVTDNVSGVIVAVNSTATLTFTITNTGNAYEKYAVTYNPITNGTTTNVFGASHLDNFNAQALSVPTVTTAAIAPGGSAVVTLVGTMPGAGLTTGDYAMYDLKAGAVNPLDNALETLANSGQISTDGSTLNCSAAIVLGDGSGTATDDVAKDGVLSARSAFLVNLTTLSVSKSFIPYWDAFDGFVQPKAIPGAIVEYSVVIQNSAGVSTAQSVMITDVLASTLTPTGYSSSWTSSAAGGPTTCGANQALSKVGAGPWTCLPAPFWSSAGAGATGTATVGALATGETATILYQATIN